MKITVIGSGNGAFATAADLSYAGHEVTLYASEKYSKNFNGIQDNIIHCVGDKFIGNIKIQRITHSIEEAMRRPDLIIVCTPATTHEDVAAEIAPFIVSGTKILLSPGSMCGSLVFNRVFRELGVDASVKFAEFHTLPYTARKEGTDSINISLFTKVLYFAAFPAKFNNEMFELISKLYPQSKLVYDVLEVGLNNGNATTHPAPIVLNAGKIEYYGKHSHYSEGITPSVGKVIQDIDDERKNICSKLNYEKIDIKDRLYEMGYCPHEETVYECIHNSEVFMPLTGPNDLNSRYLVEDVPYALVPMAEIAKIARVNTPVMDAVITLASALKNENYRKNGRNLRNMGLDFRTIEEIQTYLETGR